MIARWLVFLAMVSMFCAPAVADMRPWTSGDYFRQYSLLYNGKIPLPHIRSADQALLFGQLVNSRNISSILNSADAADIKVRELRKIFATVGAYRASYNLAVFYGEPLQQELTRVQVFGLEVAAAVAKLARQQDGVPCGAITTMIIGMIESIGEEQRYSADQSAEIAEAIARYYPEIAPVLAADDRTLLARQGRGAGCSHHVTDRQRVAIAAMWSVIASGP